MSGLQRLALVLLSAAALGGLAQASVVVPLSLDEMTDQAEGIFVGTCSSKRSYWKDRKIWTDATFRIDRRVKGSSSGQVVIRLLGGRVSDPAPVAMRVAGAAHFEVGDTALLFTKRRADGAERIVGLWQGHLPLVQDPASGNWRAPDGRLLDDVLSHIETRLKGSARR